MRVISIPFLGGHFPVARSNRPGAGPSVAREYLGVFGVLSALTLAGWFLPVNYHVFGHAYLLAVIVLSVRVGRWPALLAALASAVAWNFVFIPPRLSFSVVHLDDVLLLGSYLVVALIGSQLTAQIREQERNERLLKQRATALFHLTRALAGARRLDDAVEAALRQTDEFFGAHTALLLADENGELLAHPAGTFRLSQREWAVAQDVRANRREAGRFTAILAAAGDGLHLPLLRADCCLGVFSLRFPDEVAELTAMQRELIDSFATQIAQLLEREQLRAAGEREKLLAESARLHRTLLDSVSHELKTPLAVLRSAISHLGTASDARRTDLVGEIRTANERLDRLVANLLNQTRLEAGPLRAQLDWCDARDLIAAARRSLGDALAGRPCRLTIPAELPLFRADAALMEQVLANLLLNVARHTPPGTPVEVTAGSAERVGAVFIAIADRGPGIPAAARAQLFQKFWRGDGALAGGLGLGLSIVRGFMLAQGGDVVADDNPGGGARFVVSLPFAAHDRVPQE